MRKFQSTAPTRKLTLKYDGKLWIALISIHSPHAETDYNHLFTFQIFKSISIHSPHAETDEI